MAETKRLIFVANTSWSIYKFRFFVIQTLAEQGHSVYILAPKDEYSVHFENLKNIRFVELLNFENEKLSVRSDLRLYRELKHHYRKIRPDLIFHYTIKANIFGSLAAGRTFKSVSVITGLGFAFLKRSPIQMLARNLYRHSQRSATEVWFLNKDNLELFLRFRIIPKQKAFHLPGEGVDTETFHATSPDDHSIAIVFLMIARLARYKGIYEFVEAARILRSKAIEAEFRVLGKFDEHSKLSVKTSELKSWIDDGVINYLGESDDVSSSIKEADCVVLPSYSEGLPVSLLEASSMCKPIIASNAAGCRELIDEGKNGFLCDVKDSMSLAKKMEEFTLLSGTQKKIMGENARAKVINKYRQELIASIYLQKLKQLL